MLMNRSLVSASGSKLSSASTGGFFRELIKMEFIKHATFQMIAFPNNSLAIPYVKTTYPLDWVAVYLLNGLMKIDPVIRYGRNSKEPFFWSEMTVTVSETNVMKKTFDFGSGVIGFSLPTYDIGPYRGLLSVCPGPQDAADWESSVRLRKREIISIGFALHSEARNEIDPYKGYAANLSRREMESLQLIAAGKTHTDIAEILEISEHTARSYCRTARLKLNSSTLAQAIAKACAMGIL